jgi:predicted acetyltransferase
MAVQIRPIDPGELGAWEASMRIGFHQPEPKPDEARARDEHFAAEMDFARSFGAFDDGRVVATFRSFATELTVPGGSVTADAVTNVTVAPTHRRRGLLSTLMRDDLAAARDRGEPMAILVASEWPIYGRYGFGPATDIVEIELDARLARFAVPGAGDVTLVAPDELRRAAPQVYDAHRRATPGAIERSGAWWDRRLGLVEGFDAEPTRRYVLARDEDGAPSGLLVYTVEGNWDAWRPDGTLTVDELHAVDAATAARLWRVCAEVDLVVRVRADQRAADDPLALLLIDARAVRQRYRTDFQWVRVLDVPAALSARRYACDGGLVLEVEDELGHAAGRYSLDGGPDGAQCRPTSAPADLVLRVEALGAAYQGGASLAVLAAAGWVREERSGALARADAMFGWLARPWCATLF